MIANIKFFDADSGGRFSPPQPGYRPQIKIGGTYTSCLIESLDNEKLFDLGRQHRVSLTLMFPDQFVGALKVGDPVLLFEGKKQIGLGSIVSID